ncbi:MAG: hypothetical protein QM496_13785 [Verrucomicrobiota bacterium]
MKIQLLTTIITFTFAIAAQAQIIEKITFTTISGKTYKDAKVKKVSHEFITVYHSGGVARINFTDLPKTLRKTLDFNPEAANKAYEQRMLRETAKATIAKKAESQRKFKETSKIAIAKRKTAERAGKKITASEEIESPIIPGLVAVDVYGNFTSKGFILKKHFSTTQNEWKVTSDKGNLNHSVGIYGTDPMEITAVTGSITGLGDQAFNTAAAQFLGYLASVTYDNAKPETARRWVEENINKTGSTVISGVKFQIFANNKTARILRISAAQ